MGKERKRNGNARKDDTEEKRSSRNSHSEYTINTTMPSTVLGQVLALPEDSESEAGLEQ